MSIDTSQDGVQRVMAERSKYVIFTPTEPDSAATRLRWIARHRARAERLGLTADLPALDAAKAEVEAHAADYPEQDAGPLQPGKK
jgi:hypothetical protein